MSDRYEHYSQWVFNLGYHIIFCPKYRRKMLNKAKGGSLGWPKKGWKKK